MSTLSKYSTEQTALLMGNEAIARGAIEAGVQVCAAYPGNPYSEIIGSLCHVGEELGIYVEWSVNEKVAMEVAAAASFAGLRGLVAMKQNGLNVASDFLFHIKLTGSKGGLVVVLCDDPSALSSSNEEDSRFYAQMSDLPLLEPSSVEEAKEMTRWAFNLSEEVGLPCLIRSVTRLFHAKGNVQFGDITKHRINPGSIIPVQSPRCLSCLNTRPSTRKLGIAQIGSTNLISTFTVGRRSRSSWSSRAGQDGYIR